MKIGWFFLFYFCKKQAKFCIQNNKWKQASVNPNPIVNSILSLALLNPLKLRKSSKWKLQPLQEFGEKTLESLRQLSGGRIKVDLWLSGEGCQLGGVTAATADVPHGVLVLHWGFEACWGASCGWGRHYHVKIGLEDVRDNYTKWKLEGEMTLKRCSRIPIYIDIYRLYRYFQAWEKERIRKVHCLFLQRKLSSKFISLVVTF